MLHLAVGESLQHIVCVQPHPPTYAVLLYISCLLTLLTLLIGFSQVRSVLSIRSIRIQMGKHQPPNTKGHQLYIPDELHQKLKLLFAHGTVDDFIIKCIEAGIKPHWEEYVTREYAKVQEGRRGENRKKSVR